uniref:TANGO6 HEAT repeat domain-containing protein n=1 Tax=Ciona savignyi TaxID=51511 RepID=H2ZPR2_CIOSA
MLCYSPICRKLVSKDQRMLLLSKLTVLITKWCKLHDVAFYLLVLQGSNKRTSPAWLQQHCGHILSKCILRKGGVSEVATAIIKSLDSEMSDWQKSEIISGILTTPSRSSLSTGSYCSTICQQILEILESYTAYSTPKFGLTTSINIVHLILTQFKHPDKETMIKEVFVPYLPVLFHLFSWARNNWSPIAKQLSEIIEACLVESSNCTLTAKLFLVVCHVLETNCVETSVPLIFPKEGTDYMVTQDGECMATHKEVNLM